MLKSQFLKTTHHTAFGVLNAAHGFFETLFRPEGHRVNVYVRKWDTHVIYFIGC